MIEKEPDKNTLQEYFNADWMQEARDRILDRYNRGEMDEKALKILLATTNIMEAGLK